MHPFGKTKSSHWTRSKFIDLNCLHLKWEHTIFVIPFTFWNKYISCGSFFSLNKFFFHENPDYDYTPYWGQTKISMIKKEEKAVRKPKRQKSPRNSNDRGHFQITRKTNSLNRVSMPRPKQWKGANQRRAEKKR